jgi:predicted N-acetyltransferase YhbS
MPDMLVNLLKLPDAGALDRQLKNDGVLIRRAWPFEISPIRSFIEQEFSIGWADEISVGFSNKPVTVFIATRDMNVIGFAAYECTSKAFFGPTGVSKAERGKGIGKLLLLASLQGLKELGYVYGIIGGAGPTEFYERAVGATVIAGSEPGIYEEIVRSQ